MKKAFVLINVTLTIMIVLVAFVTYDRYIQSSRHNEQYTPQDISQNIWQERDINVDNQQNPSPMQSLQDGIVTTIQDVAPSVVSILITKDVQVFRQDPWWFFTRPEYSTSVPTQVWGGSGIIFSREWLIITNKHVVQDLDASYTVILYDGTELQVDKVWLDPFIDLAVIRVAPQSLQQLEQQNKQLTPARFLPLGDKVQIGQFAIAIGNALAEYQNSVTLGIVSGKNRQLDRLASQDLYIGLYQTDTSINPWNSGGPLMDINGQVIGINTAISAQADGIGFALPVNQSFIDATVQVIQEYGQIVRPFLWVQYVDLSVKVARQLEIDVTQGTLVKDVVPWTPAAQAWLLPGDIVTHINGMQVDTDIPFLYQVYTFVPWQTLVLTIQRGDEILQKDLTLTTNNVNS